MIKSRIALILATSMLACGLSGVIAAQDFDRSFLKDYSKLQPHPLPNNAGTDYFYIMPGAEEGAGKYTAVMVDEPEVLMSANSDYKGAKPTDLMAIAALLRTDMSEALAARGYKVVASPGPNVVYIRPAITDLSLVRKKRPLLAYTPVGIVVKAAADATRDMMGKYDIVGAVIQAQVIDSASNNILAEFAAARASAGQRRTFDDLQAAVKDFGARFACRLDNGRVAAAQRIDCLDPAARKAHEGTKSKP